MIMPITFSFLRTDCILTMMVEVYSLSFGNYNIWQMVAALFC